MKPYEISERKAVEIASFIHEVLEEMRRMDAGVSGPQNPINKVLAVWGAALWEEITGEPL